METTTIRALRAAGVAGDMARLAALTTVVWALLEQSPENIGRFTAVLVALLVPRVAGVARPFDAAFGWTLLLAALAAAAGWYKTISWVDWVIHFVTTGAVAAMAVLVLGKAGLVPPLHGSSPRRHRASPLLLTTTIGLSIGVLWEFYEWIATEVFGVPMVVDYTDTVADLAMDGLGSLTAGIAVTGWAVHGFSHRRAPLTMGDD